VVRALACTLSSLSLTTSGLTTADRGFQFALLEISMSLSLHEIIYSIFTEVVICTLISSFSFKESNKPIKWDMGTITSPRVESEKDHTLPLIVTSLT